MPADSPRRHMPSKEQETDWAQGRCNTALRHLSFNILNHFGRDS